MRHTLLALASLLCLACCGHNAAQDALNDAELALQAGDSAKAVALLKGHVARLDKAGAEYCEATLLLCNALAETKPEEAKDLLLTLAAEQPTAVKPRDFRDVQSYLQTHSHYSVAVDVMDAGLKRWPGDATMLEVKDVLIARIQSVGDEAGMSKLKGLGYM